MPAPRRPRRLGDRAAVAEALGVRPETVTQWRQRFADHPDTPCPAPVETYGKSAVYDLDEWIAWRATRPETAGRPPARPPAPEPPTRRTRRRPTT